MIATLVAAWLTQSAGEPPGVSRTELPALPAEVAPIEPDPRGCLVGRLVDPDGKPVAGDVEWGKPGKSVTARAGADGAFRFDQVPEGAERGVPLLARAPGWLALEAEEVAGSALAHRDAGDVVFRQPGATLRGRVVDPSGRPVSGARVEIHRPEGESRLWSDLPLCVAVTDARGEYAVFGLGSMHHVRLVQPLLPWARAVDRRANPGEPEVQETRLVVGRVVEGRVLDFAGNGWPGLQVRWTSEQLHELVRLEAVTDADGSFRLSGVPAVCGEVEVLDVRGNVWLSCAVEADADRCTLAPVLGALLLQPVDRESGAPLPFAWVATAPWAANHRHGPPDPLPVSWPWRADAVSVEAPGYRSVQIGPFVPPGSGVRRVEIPLERTEDNDHATGPLALDGILRGRVRTDAGRPVVGARVVWRPRWAESAANPATETWTDADGGFHLDGLPGRGGDLVVDAGLEGWAVEIVVAPAEPRFVLRPPGPLRPDWRIAASGEESSTTVAASDSPLRVTGQVLLGGRPARARIVTVYQQVLLGGGFREGWHEAGSGETDVHGRYDVPVQLDGSRGTDVGWVAVGALPHDGGPHLDQHFGALRRAVALPPSGRLRVDFDDVVTKVRFELRDPEGRVLPYDPEQWPVGLPGWPVSPRGRRRMCGLESPFDPHVDYEFELGRGAWRAVLWTESCGHVIHDFVVDGPEPRTIRLTAALPRTLEVAAQGGSWLEITDDQGHRLPGHAGILGRFETPLRPDGGCFLARLAVLQENRYRVTVYDPAAAGAGRGDVRWSRLVEITPDSPPVVSVAEAED